MTAGGFMQLERPKRFFDALRAGLLGPSLSTSEVAGCNALLTALAAWPESWTAYGMATAYHESGHTMQPVRECGSDAYLTRMYDPEGLRPEVAAKLGNTEPGDGIRFAGRGFVQLTGRGNYARADAELKLSGVLLDNPDLALTPSLAAKMLERGMREGWFTGRKLRDFLPVAGPATRAEFMAARRVVNGTDRADLIADYALRFAEALEAGA
jgi:putative chitinase